MTANRGFSLTALFVLASVVLVSGSGQSTLANERPVADAGLVRYAAAGPVQLDGSGSYDPDVSGPLTYAWRQISGPLVTMTDANSATPLISGPSQPDSRGRVIPGAFAFVQTDAIQEWEFELTVSDGELTSLPDIAKVVIVPFYGADTLELEHAPFDANKPTILFFGGGDGVNGSPGQAWGGPGWMERANLINFLSGYTPDGTGDVRAYYKYGDMTIVYLSSVAPDYRQPIQTIGWSTGGLPAIDVGVRINRTYKDARYAVNHVTLIDTGAVLDLRGNPSYHMDQLVTSGVDGEQCWVDNYLGATAQTYPNVLNVHSALSHPDICDWYYASLATSGASQFNHGVVAGAYWSVIGPGKNLQLALTPGVQTYKFRWVGSVTTGQMEFYNESSHPGRLPEPVTLGAWVSRSEVSGDIDGAVLSCDECENAAGYELLFGSNPYRVMDYNVVSDTPAPPTEVLRDFPSEKTWWTVRVRDQFGSTIYADPIRLDPTSLPPMSVENARTGKRYALIQHAIRDAESADIILLNPATYDENIDFGGKTLTVRSLDPNNPVVVAGTIIRGRDGSPTVTFSGPESGGGVLAGLTIQSGTVGVSCRDAVPTVRNCVVESPDGIAIEFWWGRKPDLIACTLLGQVKEGGDPGLIAYWRLDEAQGAVAADSAGTNNATLMGDPLWQSASGKVGGAVQLDGIDDHLPTAFILNPATGPCSVFAWIKGGAPGQTILSQGNGADWLMAAATGGVLSTELKSPGRAGKALISASVITDGAWHRVGFVWDGATRILYVDGVEVAKDTQSGLTGSTSGLYIGAGSTMAPASFWKGLIDDVRIYNRAVKP